MVVLKPLYKIAEAGAYQQAIYSKYYKEKLFITIFTYNPYLLITTLKEIFRVMGIQINNTIILVNKKFLTFKKDKL